MTEENKDLNTNQSVADSGLKDQSATGQDLNQPVTGQLADGDDKDKKTVKYTEFEKANKAKATAEEEARVLREQMAIMAANSQTVANPVQTQQPVNVYDQARADLGLSGEEFLSESERGKVIQRTIELQNAQFQTQQQLQANQQFAQSHADFGEVVGRFIGTQFQPSAELTKILTEKSHLTNAAYASAQGAYKIVMDERELNKLKEQNTVNEEHLKQQGIDTTLAPVSGAAAAGGAVSNKATGIVTAEQQAEMEQRVASGEFNKKG